MQLHLRKTLCLSVLALAVGCGRYEPGDYTSTGGTGQTGGSQSDPDKTDGGGFDDTADCPRDTDGSRTPLAFAIVEIGLGEDGFIELLNPKDVPANVFEFELQGSAEWAIPEDFAANERLILNAVLDTSGELAIRSNKGALLQYVCWGQQPPTNSQNEAVAIGLWSESGLCVLPPESGQSLHLTGTGTSSTDWTAAKPTPSNCP